MQVVLTVTSEIENQKRLWLRTRQTVVVGRSEHANWTFGSDGRLSQKHFELVCGRKSCTVRDLDSSNGTFLNGKQIASERTLDDKDVIKAGAVTFAVSIKGQPVANSGGAANATESPGDPEAIAQFWQAFEDR